MKAISLRIVVEKLRYVNPYAHAIRASKSQPIQPNTEPPSGGVACPDTAAGVHSANPLKENLVCVNGAILEALAQSAKSHCPIIFAGSPYTPWTAVSAAVHSSKAVGG